MSSAANVFYSAGLVLLTFQDALTLVEQVGFFTILGLPSINYEFSLSATQFLCLP